jgi:hypothetical protein
MLLRFRADAEYDEYKLVYYPLLVKHGLTWQLFDGRDGKPELVIFCELKYPGWPAGAVNVNREHFNPDSRTDVPGAQPTIYTAIITLAEWLAMGQTEASFQNIRNAKTSSMVHEIFHHIQQFYFGPEGSPTWKKACALAGINEDYGGKVSGDYHFKPVWENMANYFEDIVEGRKENEAFMEFIRGLLYKRCARIASAEYKNLPDEDGLVRAWLPVRKVGDRLQMVTEYSELTRDVWVVDF